MIILFLLFGVVRGVDYRNSVGTYSSKALYNIVDGIIPQSLAFVKGCNQDLQLSRSTPSQYVPISCADIRFSMYDEEIITLDASQAAVERKYTESLAESISGVCKIKVASHGSSFGTNVYKNGRNVVFLNRYGSCNNTLSESSQFKENVTDHSEGCSDIGKKHILTSHECNKYHDITITDIFNKDKPYGCIDGQFNLFDRKNDLEDSDVTEEIDSLKNKRIDALKEEITNLEAQYANLALDTPPVPNYHKVDEIDESGDAREILIARLTNMGRYFKSIWSKQAYYDSLVQYTNTEFGKIEETRKIVQDVEMLASILKNAYENTSNITTTTSTKSQSEDTFETNQKDLRDKKQNLDLKIEQSNLDDLLYGGTNKPSIYTVYENYFNESGCGNADDAILTRVIGCIPGLDFDLSCGQDGVAGECTIGRQSVSYSYPVDGGSALTFGSLGISFEQALESSDCPFNYMCKSGDNVVVLDFESIFRSLVCVPFCFPALEARPEPKDRLLTAVFKSGERFEARRTNKEYILQDIYNLEHFLGSGKWHEGTHTVTINELYDEYVRGQHVCRSFDVVGGDKHIGINFEDAVRCESERCYEMFPSYEDAVSKCFDDCGQNGFSIYWDPTPKRQASRVEKHYRIECLCGLPVNELDCVMGNNEWVEDFFIEQYELKPHDPVFTREVTYDDMYLYCPVSNCATGYVAQKCGSCNVGDWFSDICIPPGPVSFCKNEFVEEECMCGSEGEKCEPGYYCAKDGVCMGVVSTDKHILQARYKHIVYS